MNVFTHFLNEIFQNFNKNEMIMSKLSQATFSLDEMLDLANIFLQECDECAGNLDNQSLLLILKELAKEQLFMDNIFEDIVIAEHLEVMVDKQDFLNHFSLNECYEPHGDIFLTIVNSNFFEDYETFNFGTILHEKVYSIQQSTANFLKMKQVNERFITSPWNSFY